MCRFFLETHTNGVAYISMENRKPSTRQVSSKVELTALMNAICTGFLLEKHINDLKETVMIYLNLFVATQDLAIFSFLKAM